MLLVCKSPASCRCFQMVCTDVQMSQWLGNIKGSWSCTVFMRFWWGKSDEAGGWFKTQALTDTCLEFQAFLNHTKQCLEYDMYLWIHHGITKAWRGHFPMNLHMNLHMQYPQLAMKWTFPSCPIGDLIGYEIIYFNRKLHMLLDMEMNLPGFRMACQAGHLRGVLMALLLPNCLWQYSRQNRTTKYIW